MKPATAPTAGDRLGPYELVALIGAGGMGEVWKARDTRVDRVVAIKFSQAEFSERFEREARAIAALNHPNICHLYDVGPNYLVMEYVEGSPVSAPGDTRKLLDIGVQIADGLAAAHAAGVIHRDLKPDNILVTKAGRVKILDFGLAKRVTAGPDEATIAMTNPGMIMGTVVYMSPEQARGLELDARSDQFSFGLILYELASGRRAFQRGSSAETMTAIIREEPEALPATVPAPLRWIVERCLSKDPGARYDSTRDLYQELRTLREHLSEAVVASAGQKAGGRLKSLTPLYLAIAAVTSSLAVVSFLMPRRTAAPELKYTAFAADACNEQYPAWSPDGRTMAYSCAIDYVSQIFTRALDAAVPAQVTRGPRAPIGRSGRPTGRTFTSSADTTFTRSAPRAGPRNCS